MDPTFSSEAAELGKGYSLQLSLFKPCAGKLAGLFKTSVERLLIKERENVLKAQVGSLIFFANF